MNHFEKTGYMIDPKKCEGCKYAVTKVGHGAYSHCDLYFQSRREKRPTPNKHGQCIHKDTGPKTRTTIIWEEY